MTSLRAMALLVVLVGACLAPGQAFARVPLESTSPSAIENSREGSTAWTTDVPVSPVAEGYTSQISVAPGENVEFHIHAIDRYRLQIYRLGWYGGSGGRLITCLPSCTSSVPPTNDRPTISGAEPLRAGWSVSTRYTIPLSWPSGVYVALPIAQRQRDSIEGAPIPFVVRELPPSSSSILVVLPVSTWEAYNNWGGKSLYTFNSTNAVSAVRVSFERPFADLYNFDRFDRPLIGFLEEMGYPISYAADVDIERNPDELLRHRVVIVSGHSEYWSQGIRTAFERARGSGVNLVFAGANVGYWQVRYEDADRTIVEYRRPELDPEPDPTKKTTLFRNLVPARPECALLGVQYDDGRAPAGAAAGTYWIDPTASDDAWFAGTGPKMSAIPDSVSYEWDHVISGCDVGAPVTVLFHSQSPWLADAVRYRYPSGAMVFSAGTLGFGSALLHSEQTDGRFAAFFSNAIQSMVG